MMKKVVFLVFIICVVSGFASAQKTVRKRQKTSSVQTSEKQSTEQVNSQQNNQGSVDAEVIYTPLKILDKPKLLISRPLNGQFCGRGKIVLRVSFLMTGEVGSISVIVGAPYGLTESAIEAAQKIKFEPAQKNGIPVSVTKPVEYFYGVY